MIKVLQFSPHNENCGIAKYQEQFVAEVKADEKSLGVETDFYDSSHYKTRVMNGTELDAEMNKLTKTLQDGNYDILHIQHEFGLFTRDEFARMVEAGKRAGVKVAVTVHLSPALAFKKEPRGGIGLRSWIHVARQKRLEGIFIRRHIEPFRQCDLVIAHNSGATNSLISYGVSPDKIYQMLHPVVNRVDQSIKSTEISKKLNRQPGDIIMSMVGYMHRFKGHEEAVRSLRFLPENYKLAILGGMQPVSDEINIYNHICNVIDELNLRDRVYITGYVENDDYLNALIRETDICVYPYNNTYYGQVSSGALNLAFANSVPVVSYPVDNFKDASRDYGQIVFTSAAAYYELARTVQAIDIKSQQQKIKKFASDYSWKASTRRICEQYGKLIND